MSSTRCIFFWFAAFFPPANDDEVDYYEVLEVSPKATKEEIRKAYKKKSLAMHPDKIQQRGEGGGSGSDSAHKQFQAIQEAHTVLTDDKKRKMYDLLNRSPTRFKFMNDEGALQSSFENLAKSTCLQKSRLVLLLAIVLGIFLLTPILVCVKINHDLEGGALENTPWIVILIPWWILSFFTVMGSFLGFMFMGCNLAGFVQLVETFSWAVGQVLLALRWDLTLTANYAIIFIPFYIALGFRVLGLLLTMGQMSHNIGNMITLEKLEGILEKSYEDLTEEEQEDLANQYIIVHVPHDAVPTDVDDDDYVKLSPEYQDAIRIYYHAYMGLFNAFLFGVPLMVLIVLKIDYVLFASWWTVFIPVWVYLGVQLVYNCYSCACTSEGDEIVVIAPHAGNEADDHPPDSAVEHEEHASSDFVTPLSPIGQFNTNDDAQRSKHANIGDFSDQPVHKTSSSEARPSTTPVPVSSTTSPTTTGAAEANADTEQEFEMDEETYEKFQHAFQQAEANAHEAQSKSARNLCALLFQLMMACLIVGKLQADVPADDDIGYNALWIIFPILVIAGCICCCGTCMIYCSPTSAGSDAVKNAASQRSDSAAEGGTKNDEEAPIVITPSSPPQDDTDVNLSTAVETEARAKEEILSSETKAKIGGFDSDELD